MIPGISVLLALIIISEIAADMNRWGSSKRFASWLGVCPGLEVSGGKIISGASRKVNTTASQAFHMAAMGVRRSDNAFGEFYRRMKFKGGPRKALTATVHKIARAVFAMLKYGAYYVMESAKEMAKRNRERKESWLSKEAAKLGKTLVSKAE
jgi:transposase